MIEIADDLNEARLIATRDTLDTGDGAACIRVYSTARPAKGAAPGADPLVEITLTKPCGTVAGGALTLTAEPEAMVANSGTAAWARVLKGDGTFAFDCDVSQFGAAEPDRRELELGQLELFAGGLVELISAVLG